MKKYLILAAFAAVALGACTKVETTQTVVDEPVSFGVYVPQTKAGAAGQTTTTSIQRAQADGGGFGVFAYYTDDVDYSADAFKANFMYNQGVFYSSSAWAYSPVKYWPNEFGSSAISTAQDKLTFLAYAPYVSSASGTDGITAMVTNSVSKDAFVTYTLAADPTKAVDLCWGVQQSTGLPFENLTKQATDGKVSFYFKHALARFNVNVRGWFDAVRSGEGAISTKDVDENTKITIEKIEITGDLVPSGDLNLRNTTANVAKWTPATATSTTLTIANSDVATSLKATVGGETAFPGTSVTGVTKTNVNVFTGAAPTAADAKYFTLIPYDSATTLTVTITYYVTTKDTALADQISCVKNVIKKEISFDKFECGKIYNLNVVLGMTTVKLEATVADWDTTVTNKDIDLPQNL